MKTKSKRISLALMVVVGIAAVAAMLWKKESPPQIIMLPNGLKVQFVGVTYGTNHVQPGLAARFVSKMPSPLINLVQRVLGKRFGPIISFRTPKASLGLWFKTVERYETGWDWMKFAARLADDQGTVYSETGINFQRDNSWSYAVFEKVPKSSREFQCVLNQYSYGVTLSSEVRIRDYSGGRVRFPNPLYGGAE